MFITVVFVKLYHLVVIYHFYLYMYAGGRLDGAPEEKTPLQV